MMIIEECKNFAQEANFALDQSTNFSDNKERIRQYLENLQMQHTEDEYEEITGQLMADIASYTCLSLMQNEKLVEKFVSLYGKLIILRRYLLK